MDDYLKVSIIGLVTGIAASFVGGGAEILIVPLLIYLNVLSDYKEAIATSLASLLLPIGIVAVYFTVHKIVQNAFIELYIYYFFILYWVLLQLYSSSLDGKQLKIIFAGLMILLGSLILYEEIY